MSIRSIAVGAAVGALIALGAAALAQGAVAPLKAAPGNFEVTRMNDRIFVAVKDLGDSQVVMVYTFDEAGKMSPTPQKLRFYYQ